MGGLKNLGRGLAAGMSVFGQGIINKEAREEDKRRFDEQSARAERQLQIQEKAAADAAKMAELNLAMKRVQYNNKMLVNAVRQNDYDPTVTMNALNTYGPTGGRIFKKNEAESSKTGGIVWDVGTYRMTKEGNPELNEDGTFAWDQLPGDSGRVSFKDKAEMAAWVTPQLAPDVMLATDLAGITGEQTRQQANERFKKQATEDAEFLAKYADTPAGQKIIAAQEKEKAELAKIKAETKLAKSKAGLADAQAKEVPNAGDAKKAQQAGSYTGIDGKEHTQTSQQVEKAKAFAGALNKTGEYGQVDPDDAARIMDFKGDNKSQAKVKKAVQLVDNGTWTKEKFKEELSTSNLPPEFLDKLLADYMAAPAPEKRSVWDQIFSRLPFVD